jgi:hypothetical protein
VKLFPIAVISDPTGQSYCKLEQITHTQNVFHSQKNGLHGKL